MKNYLQRYKNSIYRPNSIENWSGSDNEEEWEKNIKLHPTHKDLNYYSDNPIVYKHNNYGYRTPYNFKKGDVVDIYLGCSFTVGIGQPLDDTWSFLLHNKLNKHENHDTNFVNLAQGGEGIENQFRQLINWVDFFKVKNIFHYQPFYAREEWFIDKKPVSFQVSTPYLEYKPPLKNLDKNLIVNVFGDDTFVYRKYLTNILAISNIAHRYNIDYYYVHENKYVKKIQNKDRQARDLSHMSTNQNINLCNLFYKKWTNKDTTIDFLNLKYNISLF